MEQEKLDETLDSGDGREACWECGVSAYCTEHFTPCSGMVMRLCEACLMQRSYSADAKPHGLDSCTNVSPGPTDQPTPH